MSDNLFDIQADDTPTIDESVDYLEVLVGEGKKFKDVKDLAKGKAHADTTIEVMKQKLDELTKQLSEAKSLEAVLTEIRSQKEPPVVNNPVEITPDPATIDDSFIEKRLEELLARREAQKAAETNREYVSRVLVESLGDTERVKQVLAHKSKELGMTGQALESLANQNPKAFFKLLDIQEGSPQRVTPSVPTSSYNAQFQNGVKRGHSYYEKMKRDNPQQYRSPKTTSDMIKDMQALGREEYYRS